MLVERILAFTLTWCRYKRTH